MLRVSKLTDYATVVMASLIDVDDGVLSAQALAERTRLEPTTVSKLLKQLAQAGLVVATRGASGGYRLARAAAAISVADIVVAMEGPIGMTECGARRGGCDHELHCGTRVNWQRINRVIVEALQGVSLADMARQPPPRRSATALQAARA
ncbi:MAG: SUF system Fe-S cluster assembly regulator [Xanthomonadales bacterium]|nr:SUF system Fe-S cluster assembly regulator [Xanthomonadales bacterium]MCW5579664.1 SUF system Fe-S cluster assembly regulator [Dokdonella sp.]MDL1870150.1 SUF system Fe-S cluster assembly regulator [Gammaproteobacteria bacterium PRO6]